MMDLGCPQTTKCRVRRTVCRRDRGYGIYFFYTVTLLHSSFCFGLNLLLSISAQLFFFRFYGMSKRVAKARAIREATRKKRDGGVIPYLDGAYELGLSGTIAMVLLLLLLGASMMTIYMIQSGCRMTEDTTTTATTTKVSIRQKEKVPSCSSSQMETLKTVMPQNFCQGQAFAHICSFSVATVKSGCQDTTTYFRIPIASMKLSNPFTALFVGFEAKDDTPMDLLAIGNHNPDKYSLSKWNEAWGGPHTCPKTPFPIDPRGNTEKAQIFVVDEDSKRYQKLMDIKKRVGFDNEDDQDFIVSKTKISTHGRDSSEEMSLERWMKTNLSEKGELHYLKLYAWGGRDYDVLKSGGKALRRIWYMEFFYDSKGEWEIGSMKGLIHEILDSFACYWHGANNNLWRITGCWQRHYAFSSWSKLVCVNAEIPEARPIFIQMEEAFTKTLEKGEINLPKEDPP